MARKIAKKSSKKSTAKSAKKVRPVRKKSAAKKTTTTVAKAKKKASGKKKLVSKKSVAKKVVKKAGRKKKATAAKAPAKARPITKAKSKVRRTSSAKAVRSSPKPSAPSAKPLIATSPEEDNGQYIEKKVPKTHLTKKPLQRFKQLLLDKRAELAGDVTNLTRDMGNNKRDGSGGASSVPMHMADVGTDNWEQEFTFGLIENEQDRIREIDAALKRIQNKTYGVCQATHVPISLARLEAKPWAKYCIEYARAREEGRAV